MKFLGLLLVVLLLNACDRRPATPGHLEGRLDAANAISEPNSRNDSLGKLAIDAANAKDSSTATKAIDGISDPNRKNSTAQTCALVLSKNADPKAATAIAQLISDPNLRNSTLQAIAKGE